MKKIILVFISLFYFQLVFAQKSNVVLSPDTLKFFNDFKSYFIDNTINKDEADKFLDDFEKKWKLPEFNASYKKQLISTTQKFVERRLKSYPYLHDYVLSVTSFIDAKRSVQEFTNWQLCIDKILTSKNNTALSKFLEMSLNLFLDNTFFATPSYIWKSSTSTYVFEVDSTPKVIFKSINVIGKNPRNDSIVIENTQGVYYPTTSKFIGNGGKVSWARTGLESDVRAEFKRKYIIDCNSGSYTIDSVMFYNKKYFAKPLLGKLQDKVITQKEEFESYPRFDSYSKVETINNIVPGADYEGAFRMRGPNFVGGGDNVNPAKIVFKYKGKRILEAIAKSFTISKEKISSENAQIKIRLDKDSIIHPGLNFKYIVEQKKISLVRLDQGQQKAPYTNTFHKLDMYFEELTWIVDDPKMDFGFIVNNLQGEAYFESADFFNPQRMIDIQGADKTNPIYETIKYYNSNSKPEKFTLTDLAKAMKYLKEELHPIVTKMANFGLLFYNPETGDISTRSRLFDYGQSFKKKKDYDIITFHSVMPGKTNAMLSLIDYDLTVDGVKQILLSDSQKVIVFPKNQQVIIHKNRNFDFAGQVGGGQFDYYIKKANFDYDKFKINIDNADSVIIYCHKQGEKKDEYSEVPDGLEFRKVQTSLENVQGELMIDNPQNKGGNIITTRYPIFKTFKESFAYYDKQATYKGVYKRDKFYFKINPFTIDSIARIPNKSIRFSGTFVSGGIFPDINDTISLQPDYSLGFKIKTPPGGLQAYGGKAKFTSEIRLSNKGLQADGDLDYLTSTSHSKNFTFFPDSLLGLADTFVIREQLAETEYPNVKGRDILIRYKPYKDALIAADKKTPFKTYDDNKAEFRGTLTLTPKLLSGRGKVDFESADLASKFIRFKNKEFFADTADFRLKALDEEGFTFSTKGLKSHIDFKKRQGDFQSNGKGSYVRFDKNQYIAYLEKFTWYMDKEQIDIGDDSKQFTQEEIDKELNIEGPEFISVHPKQDSLRFFAPSATYELKKKIIRAKNVPFINVADARVFPGDGKVSIFKNAVMDTIKNANILANTVTKYHKIKRVVANIYGRKSYLANGEYEFFDENENKYILKFATIKPDTAGQTVSEGAIPEQDNFKFNSAFSFAGKVKLYASLKNLYFDGGTKIIHNCDRIQKSYLKFDGEVDTRNINIPLSGDLKDMNNNPLASAIVYSVDSTKLYSAFISPRYNIRDKDVQGANGFLTFDKKASEYRIGTKEKLIERNIEGNYISLNTKTCVVSGEGKLQIGTDLGRFEANSAGTIIHTSVNDSLKIRTALAVDFFFDDKLLNFLVKDFELYGGALKATNASDPFFEKSLKELIGKEKSDKVISDINLYGTIRKFPDELKKAIVFSDITFKWNKPSNSYVSNGELGVSNILKENINKYVKGLVQIQKKRGADLVNMYIEFDANNWYFFYYYKGLLNAISSNKEFNNYLKELKTDKRKQKAEDGKPSFNYAIGTENKKRQFLMKTKTTEEEEE